MTEPYPDAMFEVTDEEILKLAKSCGFNKQEYDNGNCWECWEDQLLKFSLAIRDDGYDRGYYNACIDEAGCVDD